MTAARIRELSKEFAEESAQAARELLALMATENDDSSLKQTVERQLAYWLREIERHERAGDHRHE